uniref:beta-glucosidase n=1 Tax=Globisporangium ultimum (strain ATCC 200006 / CBS 805.95 / DAOM BR144) TaxID=431595 RepID=K3W7L4_GLOUD
MLRSWLGAVCCCAVLACNSVAAVAAADAWDSKADAIMSKFTLDDILGQMTQINIDNILNADLTLNEDRVREYAKLRIGSYLNSPYSGGPKDGKYGWTAQEWRKLITRIQEISMVENGGHPIVYGIDSVHGAVYISNSTLFGQQINGGASFNPDLVYEMGRVTGRDTEAAGIPWVFGPILEISQNPLWARTFETFGEDPYLVSVMADSVIRGLQSNNATAACMKHFVGYSKTPTGHDRDGVTLSDFDLLNYFVPPFIAAINAGVMSTMENYISINGVPVVSSPKILRDLIRSDMGFEGVAVTDYAEINNLQDWHRVARSKPEAVRMALTQTSLDMSMVPYGHSNPEYLDRLKESARRVVKMKLKLGLYDNPVPGAANVDLVGNEKDIASALELARESITLLKNQDSVLPIAPTSSVFLTGHSADNVGYLCGGWTKTWQGVSGNAMFPHGISVKQGFEKIGNSSVTYFNGLSADGSYTAADMAAAKAQARVAEYTVAVIGESTYAEKPGDINDLALPAGQIAYVRELASTGTKVIVVLVGGRPRLLNGLAGSVHAVINAFLPCEQGGQAIAEIIYGKVNPSGRMPITYPKDAANIMIPYNHRVSTQCSSGYCQMEWDFGAGLSYTTFMYSSVKLSKTTVTGKSDSITASVTVTNSGKMAGKETVMLFVIQPYRSISVPEVKQLKKFKKISLDAGASTTVEFTLTAADWSVYDPQIGNGFVQVAEDGDFVVAVKPETECNVYGAITNPLCAKFELKTGVEPFNLEESLKTRY